MSSDTVRASDWNEHLAMRLVSIDSIHDRRAFRGARRVERLGFGSVWILFVTLLCSGGTPTRLPSKNHRRTFGNLGRDPRGGRREAFVHRLGGD